MSTKQPGTGTLFTAHGACQLDLRIAKTFLARFRGLMLAAPLAPAQGLLIPHCPSVHCAFMRYPIDVVYLDRRGIVTRCVPNLRPWRASFSRLGRDAQGRRCARAFHTLELAAGAIAAYGIAPGDRLSHPEWDAPAAPRRPAPAQAAQRGSAMIEFTVVGPIITMLGLSVLQYGSLFFARNQINHASFMAAREGAAAHADLDAVHAAYARALVPMYGGGQSASELAASLAKASADLGANGAGNVNIEMLNPTKESFADWNVPALQAALKTGSRRVIPNAGQAYNTKGPGPASGQTIQDANLIKLRITHGYQPKVPFVNKIYTTYLKWLDPKTDAFHTKLVNDGRIPVVTHVTLQMQSDAIEPGAPVSVPGPGNGGTPTNPGIPPVTQDPPPECTNLGCPAPAPQPAPEPSCNPFTDPHHCNPVPCSDICCEPRRD
jgi:uncharacterized membrane protein (UPF0127 family)